MKISLNQIRQIQPGHFEFLQTEERHYGTCWRKNFKYCQCIRLLINSRSREKYFQSIYNVLGYVLVIFMPRSNDEKAMAANMAERVPGR